MEYIFNILLIIIPSGLVFLSAWILINRFLTREQHLAVIEQKINMQKQMNPMKIQAYERLIVLSERMNPAQMVLRNSSKVNTARELQIRIIEEMKSEIEHNISQQLFVSADVWNAIIKAKEELIQLVQISAQKVPENATAIELSTIILQILDNLDVKPHERPVLVIKNEFKQLYA